MTYPQQTESISSQMRKKTRVLTLAIIIQHSFGTPYHGNQRRKRNKEFRLEKKKKQKSVSDYMILIIENLKDTTRKLLELIDEFSKLIGYKTNHREIPCIPTHQQ